MAKITKEMIIVDILRMDMALVPVLKESGLHCLGCPSAHGETLEEACELHGINVDELLGKLNAKLDEKRT